MKRTASIFLSILLMAFLASGCLVAESKYMKKSDEADQLIKQVSSLETENKGLKDQVKTLTGQNEELTKQVTTLTEDNGRLKDDLARVSKKTQEVEKASNTYQQLLKEMKGEIAEGQITVKELKGKLTMDVVDKIFIRLRRGQGQERRPCGSWPGWWKF